MILDIENGIILHDVKQIRKEPPQPKIKNIFKLCKAIKKKKLSNLSDNALNAKIYRINGKKYDEKDEELVTIILKVLEIDRKDLFV